MTNLKEIKLKRIIISYLNSLIVEETSTGDLYYSECNPYRYIIFITNEHYSFSHIYLSDIKKQLLHLYSIPIGNIKDVLIECIVKHYSINKYKIE